MTPPARLAEIAMEELRELVIRDPDHSKIDYAIAVALKYLSEMTERVCEECGGSIVKHIGACLNSRGRGAKTTYLFEYEAREKEKNRASLRAPSTPPTRGPRSEDEVQKEAGRDRGVSIHERDRHGLSV